MTIDQEDKSSQNSNMNIHRGTAADSNAKAPVMPPSIKDPEEQVRTFRSVELELSDNKICYSTRISYVRTPKVLLVRLNKATTRFTTRSLVGVV